MKHNNKSKKHLDFINDGIIKIKTGSGYNCECGASLERKDTILIHNRSKKHLFYLEFYNYIIS